MANILLKKFRTIPQLLRIALLPIFVIAALIVFTHTTDAQNRNDDQSMEISPPSQEVTVDPGKTTTIVAKVRNKSNNTLPISVRIEGFIASGDQGQIALTEEDGPSVKDWTTITPKKFTLAPGEEQEVTAKVTLPKNGVAGGQYGSFIFSVTPDSDDPQAAKIAQEVASLFLIRVSGNEEEYLILDSITAPKYSEYGPITFNMKFTNTGNVHVKPYGLINVSDMFGNKVKDIVVPGNNIFPKASRVINANLDKRFLIGKYTATAIMYYGSTKNDTLTATTTFIVLPYKLLIGVFVLLFIFFKLRKNKRMKRTFKALFGK